MNVVQKTNQPCTVCGTLYIYIKSKLCKRCNDKEARVRSNRRNPLRIKVNELHVQGYKAKEIRDILAEQKVRGAQNNIITLHCVNHYLKNIDEIMGNDKVCKYEVTTLPYSFKPKPIQWSDTKWFQVMGNPATTPGLYHDDEKAIEDTGSYGKPIYSNRPSISLYGAQGGELI
jgi:hypothetical protein